MQFVVPPLSDGARLLLTKLWNAGFLVTADPPRLGTVITLQVTEHELAEVHCDSIDSDLERSVMSELRRNFIIKMDSRGGEAHSEYEMNITIPRESWREAVQAIYTGILRVRTSAPSLWKKLFASIALMFCFAGWSQAQTPTVQKVDVTKVGSTTIGTSVPVTCVSGCSGGGGGGATTIADGADVNAGATTDAAVSGDVNGTLAAKVRQLNKIFTLVWDNVNNRIHVNIDNSTLAVTQSGTWTINAITNPVSVTGTFWQATQPVSGTFWQATQPVSGPLTDAQLRASAVPVSGTFFQATQPVSGTVAATQSGIWTMQPGNTANTTPWLFTISQGGNSATVSAAGALKVDNSAVTQPVSGTFWQATQPVSGTFFQATQPVSAAALPLPSGASTEATLALIKAKTDNIDVALSTRTKPADQQHSIIDSGTTTVTQGTGTNLHTVIDSGTITTVSTVTQNADVRQSTAANLNATAVQPTGTNLHTVTDSGSVSNATLQTGSAIVGKVGIDQTTPGTTNAVASTSALPGQSGVIPVYVFGGAPPMLSQAQMNNPLLYRAAMAAYCRQNLAGCGPALSIR